jgi:hypothetical protein
MNMISKYSVIRSRSTETLILLKLDISFEIHTQNFVDIFEFFVVFRPQTKK